MKTMSVFKEAFPSFKESFKQLLRKRRFRVLVPASFALIAYGNWALYVNRETDHAVVSGIMEGLRAFTFTCIGNLLTETVWFFTSKIRPITLRVITSIVITWFTMQSIAYTIHWIINPVTALKTISLSLVISSVYVTLYMTALARVHRETRHQAFFAKK